MSLLSTLAHEGTLSAKVSSRRGLVTIVGAAVLVVSALFVVTNSTDESPVTVNTVTGSLAHEEFIRLNTTALDALVSAVVIESQMDVDPFLFWNTTALDALVPATSGARDSDVGSFLYWNTTALEYPQAGYVEPESGPR